MVHGEQQDHHDKLKLSSAMSYNRDTHIKSGLCSCPSEAGWLQIHTTENATKDDSGEKDKSSRNSLCHIIHQNEITLEYVCLCL